MMTVQSMRHVATPDDLPPPSPTPPNQLPDTYGLGFLRPPLVQNLRPAD